MKITRDKLIQMYYGEGKTSQQIGRMFDVSRQHIDQKMVEFNLPTDTKGGGKGGGYPKGVYKFNNLQEYLDYIREGRGKEQSGTLVRLILSQESLCEECGATKNLHIHHSHYPARSRDDLHILCASCHYAKRNISQEPDNIIDEEFMVKHRD